MYVLASLCSEPVPLQIPLGAMTVRIQTPQDLTLCRIYLPPDGPISQNVLAVLISQLPPPFLLLGNFNGQNPLWGGTFVSVWGKDAESVMTV